MNKIKTYLHCMKCYKSKPNDQSMKEYARINVGRTDHGIQVWCVRHNEQIIHLKYDWSELDKILPSHCGCKQCTTNK